jgi:hypothetical protein
MGYLGLDGTNGTDGTRSSKSANQQISKSANQQISEAAFVPEAEHPPALLGAWRIVNTNPSSYRYYSGLGITQDLTGFRYWPMA